MKFTFTAHELTWLHDTLNALHLISAKNLESEDGAMLARLVSKLRHKFTPNALALHMTGKERQVVSDLVGYRLSQIKGTLQEATEGATLKSISKTLGAR